MSVATTWRAFLVLLVLAPLPFGANRAWAWSLLAVGAGLVLLAWSSLVSRGALPFVWRRAFWPALGLGCGVFCWIFVQIFIPMPESVANPLWGAAAVALERDLGPTISIAPDQSGPAILRAMTYAATFWLAMQFGRDSERAWQLLRWIAIASGGYAAYGLLSYVTGNELILWYDRWAYREDVTSTFVNRNSFATFAALGLLSALALCTRAYKLSWERSDRSLPRLNRAVESLLLSRSLAYLLLSLLIGMALLQSHSRMGFFAGAVGLTVFLLLLRTSRVIRGGAAATLLCVVIGAFILVASGRGTFERIQATRDLDRLPIFELVLQAIESAPLLGYGYGSFASVFPMFRDLSVPTTIDYTEAHNTYLELALELGVVAAGGVVIAVAWFAALCGAAVYRKRRDRIVPALAAAATVTVGVHSLTDFSLQIPAVAVTYAAILGVGCARSWSTRGVTGHRR